MRNVNHAAFEYILVLLKESGMLRNFKKRKKKERKKIVLCALFSWNEWYFEIRVHIIIIFFFHFSNKLQIQRYFFRQAKQFFSTL